MAIFIGDKTKCVLCQRPVASAADAVAFPAFVPQGHPFARYSDSVFHATCFKAWDEREQFQSLYDDCRRIWDERPAGLSLEQAEQFWAAPFADLFGQDAPTSRKAV